MGREDKPSDRAAGLLAIYAAACSAGMYLIGHLDRNADILERDDFFRNGLEVLRVVSVLFFVVGVWLLWHSRKD